MRHTSKVSNDTGDIRFLQEAGSARRRVRSKFAEARKVDFGSILFE